MPESLIREYRRAKLASLAGAICMYLFSCISLLITAAFVIAIFTNVQLDAGNLTYCICVVAGLFSATLSTVLLGSFFRHFSKDPSPFGKHQSCRLLAASLLLMLRTLLDTFAKSPEYMIPLRAVDPDIFVASGPGPDLKVVVMVVFLICLAMVIRYGNALKEDSDSIA